MTKPTAKLAFLFGLYTALHFASACFDTNCDCPTVEFPFFDYRGLKATTNNPVTDKVLKIDIALDSVFFVAEASPRRGVGFVTSAYACSCDYQGSSGDKFPVVSIDVFADRDFTSQLSQDSSLIKLFEVNRMDISTGGVRNIYGSLFGQFDTPTRLTLASLPDDLSQPYVFTVRITKGNGVMMSIQTDTIRFQ